MTDEEQATRDALQAEQDRLSEEYESADELPDEIDQRLGEIEAAMEALDNRPVRFDPAEIAIAGVFVSIGSDGSLIGRPRLCPPRGRSAGRTRAAKMRRTMRRVCGRRNREPAAPAIQRAVITIGGQPAQPRRKKKTASSRCPIASSPN